MRTEKELQELAESLVNGNIGYVKEELKEYTPYELLEFVQEFAMLLSSSNPTLDAIERTMKLIQP